MAINHLVVSSIDYDQILLKFPAKYRDKLRMYTGEELFYAYKVATYKAKIVNGSFKGSDVLYLSLKTKLFRWLKGIDRHGIHPNAWVKLGSKFRYNFNVYVDAPIEDDVA